MKISVNEKPQELQPGTTIAGLLQQLNIEPRFVAVERNLELIPRAEHNECVLQPDDRLEIVTLVGGG